MFNVSKKKLLLALDQSIIENWGAPCSNYMTDSNYDLHTINRSAGVELANQHGFGGRSADQEGIFGMIVEVATTLAREIVEEECNKVRQETRLAIKELIDGLYTSDEFERDIRLG